MVIFQSSRLRESFDSVIFRKTLLLKYPYKVQFTVTVKSPPEQDSGMSKVFIMCMILCVL